ALFARYAYLILWSGIPLARSNDSVTHTHPFVCVKVHLLMGKPHEQKSGPCGPLRLLTKYRQSSRFPRELCAFMGHAERTRSTAAGDGVGDDRGAGATRSSAAED